MSRKPLWQGMSASAASPTQAPGRRGRARRGMSGRAGFTLIEVVVGMTVAALALAAGLAALGIVQDRSTHAVRASTTALSGATVRRVLSEWITTARYAAPNRAGGFQGLDTDAEGSDNDELVFPTTARTPIEADVSLVRLYLDVADSTAEKGLVAEIVERPEDDPVRLELVPEAATLEFRYLPAVADATEWLEDWVGGDGLPRAVEMTLTARRGDTLPPLLRYPLRVTLEGIR